MCICVCLCQYVYMFVFNLCLCIYVFGCVCMSTWEGGRGIFTQSPCPLDNSRHMRSKYFIPVLVDGTTKVEALTGYLQVSLTRWLTASTSM